MNKRITSISIFLTLIVSGITYAADASFDGVAEERPTLCSAADQGNLEQVIALLAAGANPDEKHMNDFSALHYAALRKNFAITQVLLDAGAQFNIVSNLGWTPLHCAALKESFEVVQALLGRGALHTISDTDGNTPLHIAVMCHNVKVIQAFLDAGADPTIKNRLGKTPLSCIQPGLPSEVYFALGMEKP